MKSIKHTLSIWTIMFVFALYISSCCTEREAKIIGEGTIESIALDRQVDIFSDSITGDFRINILVETEYVFNDLTELGFTQALATSCEDDILNPIDKESIEILFDKPFQFENSTYESETDLALIEAVKNRIDVYDYEIVLVFDINFFSKATLEKDTYNLKINYKTTDGASFSNDIDLLMNI